MLDPGHSKAKNPVHEVKIQLASRIGRRPADIVDVAYRCRVREHYIEDYLIKRNEIVAYSTLLEWFPHLHLAFAAPL